MLSLLPGTAQRCRLGTAFSFQFSCFRLAFPVAHLPQFGCRDCPKSYAAVWHLFGATPFVKSPANVGRVAIKHHQFRSFCSFLRNCTVRQHRLMETEPSGFAEAKSFPWHEGHYERASRKAFAANLDIITTRLEHFKMYTDIAAGFAIKHSFLLSFGRLGWWWWSFRARETVLQDGAPVGRAIFASLLQHSVAFIVGARRPCCQEQHNDTR